MAPSPPWSDLPVEILMEVFSPLEVSDLIRVSAVCTSFGRAVSLSPKLQEWNRSPWLMLCPSKANEDANEDDQNTPDTNEDDQNMAKYYSLSEKRVYGFSFEKPFSSWHTFGSSHGWLILADDKSNIHLYDPLTGKHIALPPVTTMDGISPILDDEGNITQYDITFWGETDVERLHHRFTKVVLSCDPAEGDYVVALVHAAGSDESGFRTQARTSFVRGGDERWTPLDDELCYLDLVFHDWLLYGVTEVGGVDVWDFTTKPSLSVQIIVREDEICDEDSSNDELIENALTDKYIICAPWGDVLVVWRKCVDTFEGNHLHQETGRMDVYKVDVSKGKLVEVKNLGDYALFVGQTSGCFSTKNSTNLRVNCIYFKEYYCSYRMSHLCVYDLGNLHYKFDASSELCSNVLSAWIVPNYRRKKYNVV